MCLEVGLLGFTHPPSLGGLATASGGAGCLSATSGGAMSLMNGGGALPTFGETMVAVQRDVGIQSLPLAGPWWWCQ